MMERIRRPVRLGCLAMLLCGSTAGAQGARETWSPGSSSIFEAEVVPPAYRGRWAPDESACADPEGVDRMTVFAEGLETYESGGRLERVTQAGQERQIKVKLAFEGETELWNEIETWTLSEDGKRLEIVEEGNSLQPATFVRCG